eukprot:GHVS01095080.1.p1 GENE.GHVS01095080.1~~GHVS01095080.1.p1  ORF type:complete len:635 (+),score=108.03 GHVS01095080.1:308-2212(+)
MFFSSHRCSHDDTHNIIKHLRVHSVGCAVAPYEASAQLAHLTLAGQLDVVISDDTDLLAFGCRRTFLLSADEWGVGVEIHFDNLKHAQLLTTDLFSHDLFILVCTLAGCAHSPPVEGLSLELAAALVQAHPNSCSSQLSLINHISKCRGVCVPFDYATQLARSCLIYKHQCVFDVRMDNFTRLRPLLHRPSEELLRWTGTTKVPRTEAWGVVRGDLHPLTHQPFSNQHHGMNSSVDHSRAAAAAPTQEDENNDRNRCATKREKGKLRKLASMISTGNQNNASGGEDDIKRPHRRKVGSTAGGSREYDDDEHKQRCGVDIIETTKAQQNNNYSINSTNLNDHSRCGGAGHRMMDKKRGAINMTAADQGDGRVGGRSGGNGLVLGGFRNRLDNEGEFVFHMLRAHRRGTHPGITGGVEHLSADRLDWYNFSNCCTTTTSLREPRRRRYPDWDITEDLRAWEMAHTASDMWKTEQLQEEEKHQQQHHQHQHQQHPRKTTSTAKTRGSDPLMFGQRKSTIRAAPTDDIGDVADCFSPTAIHLETRTLSRRQSHVPSSCGGSRAIVPPCAALIAGGTSNDTDNTQPLFFATSSTSMVDGNHSMPWSVVTTTTVNEPYCHNQQSVAVPRVLLRHPPICYH